VVEAENVPGVSPKQFLPPEAAPLPAIVFSTVATWGSVAAWYSEIVDRRAGLLEPAGFPLGAAQRAALIEATLADIRKKVRYTGLELGMSAYVPRAPAETVERGFGDCKDQSVLLVSRLRKSGIPAYVALLTPYPAPDVLADVPGLEAFAHAIVYVPGEQPVWLDPSAQFVRAGQLPITDQGRSALIIDKRTTQLVRTPESQAIDNGISDTTEIRLREGGDAVLQRGIDIVGSQEQYMRAAFANGAIQNQIRNRVASELKAKGDIQLDSASPEDLQKPFWWALTVEGYGYAGSLNGRLFAEISPVGADIGFLAAMVDAAYPQRGGPAMSGRTEDYFLPSAFVSERRTHVIAPPGFRVEHLPEIATLKLGPVTLTRTISLKKDGSVAILQRVESPRRRYTTAVAKIIAGGLRRVMSAPNVRIEFVKAVK
jgi:hypothetical protein